MTTGRINQITDANFRLRVQTGDGAAKRPSRRTEFSAPKGSVYIPTTLISTGTTAGKPPTKFPSPMYQNY